MIKILASLLFLFFSIYTSFAYAEESELEEPAYWDYGFGVGGVRFEQYPSAGQYSTFALPAPTFQYRGKILRADDKDGAHAYLFKSKNYSIEIAGQGYPALDSSNNDARKDMEDLPWLIALGPEIVSRKIADHIEFGLGIFGATTTDFRMTKYSGILYQGRMTYDWYFLIDPKGILQKEGYSSGKLTLSFQGGSKEFQSIYFEVPTVDATPDRPAYEAREGLLRYSLSYYQSYKSGLFSINMGGSVNSYELSANRESPLHRSNHSVTIFLGLNYILGGSARPEVPEDETSGVINSIRRNRQLRDSL